MAAELNSDSTQTGITKAREEEKYEIIGEDIYPEVPGSEILICLIQTQKGIDPNVHVEEEEPAWCLHNKHHH